MSNKKTTYNGIPELQEFLTEIGFSLHRSFTGAGDISPNQCNWYACRRVEQEVPLCTCNEKSVQIVIMPYSYQIDNRCSESVTVEICASVANGEWWNLQCYNVSAETLKTSLDSIENRLVTAWKAVNI